MIEVKTTVFKLYSFISKMMILVEKDLDNPHLMDGDEAVSAKKNMTNIFEKLVSPDFEIFPFLMVESPYANVLFPKT